MGRQGQRKHWYGTHPRTGVVRLPEPRIALDTSLTASDAMPVSHVGRVVVTLLTVEQARSLAQELNAAVDAAEKGC